jgi:hypothetical protein
MKYLVFNTEQEAIAAEASISASRGYARPGINAKTGEVVPEVLTIRWDIPQQIADGRWVVASPDDTGVEAGPDWWPESDWPPQMGE